MYFRVLTNLTNLGLSYHYYFTFILGYCKYSKQYAHAAATVVVVAVAVVIMLKDNYFVDNFALNIAVIVDW